MSGERKKLTVKDRILLYLYRYRNVDPKMVAPPAMTQEGISQGLCLKRSAIPRALMSLEEEGYIESLLAHVKHFRRRRKVYFLTDKGIERALSLYEGIKHMKVILKTPEEEREVEVKELFSSDVPIGSVLQGVNDGIVNLGIEEKKTVVYFNPPVEGPDIFVGREKEWAELLELIDGKGGRMVCLIGVAGIGKSSLALRVLEDIGEKRDVFYLKLDHWTDLRWVAENLRRFLKERKQIIQYSNLYLGEDDPLKESLSMLEFINDHGGAVIALDDLHRAPPDLNNLLRAAKDRLSEWEELNFLIISRERPEFYDVRDERLLGKVHLITLKGLNEDEAKLLIKSGRGGELDYEWVERLLEATGGHPLALHLLKDREVVPEYRKGLGRVEDFLNREILGGLSEGQKRFLKALTTSTIPVGRDEATEYFGIDPGDVEDLLVRGLVVEEENSLRIHEFVEGLLKGRGKDPDLLRRWIKLLVDRLKREAPALNDGSMRFWLGTVYRWGEERPGIERGKIAREVLELVKLLVSAGQVDEGKRLAMYGLWQEGLREPLLYLLNDGRLEGESPQDLYLKGEAKLLQGDFERAQELFLKAWNLAREGEEERMIINAILLRLLEVAERRSDDELYERAYRSLYSRNFSSPAWRHFLSARRCLYHSFRGEVDKLLTKLKSLSEDILSSDVPERFSGAFSMYVEALQNGDIPGAQKAIEAMINAIRMDPIYYLYRTPYGSLTDMCQTALMNMEIYRGGKE